MIKYVCDICGEDATHSVKVLYDGVENQEEPGLLNDGDDDKHGHLCNKHFEEFVNNLKGEG